jgi:hypothetical protein
VNAILDRLAPYMKAVVGGVIGTVAPLLIAGFASGWDWQAILGAVVTGALTGLGVYEIPNAGRAQPTAVATESPRATRRPEP